ncbi:MAG TPA: TonB-dependent receptor [Casimicrobiaceae bacterium]|nr:TonB-dependent receptor [Casimicrobiaceae bacterium]
MHRKKLSLAVTQAVGAGILVGLAAPAAYGQTPAGYQEKITVTGTRIPSPNIESTSPISIISPVDIKIEHPVSIENLLNNMPQVFADQGNMLSNAATGTAAVDLRGLGASRTLVLINGRRLPAGDPTIYATDINSIPLPLIQRVDIYTGGASAVYGSDAISGVVNFIMNDRFQGVQFDWGHSFYNHQQNNGLASVIAARAVTNPSQFKVPGDVDSDGEVENYSVAMGSDFANGKGNATVFLGYTRQHPVLQRDRDYSACATGQSATGFTCGGSSTAYPGRFTDLNTGANFTIADSAGTVRPFNSALDQFNFAPYNFYQRPDERYLADFFAHYDILPWMRTYTEFEFMDDRTLAQIAPGGIFYGGPGSENHLTFDNPLLSASFKDAFGITPDTPGDVLIGRRNLEGGGRQTDLRHTDYRGVLGFKGELPFAPGWDYDAWYQMGKNVFQSTFLNDFSGQRILKALDVVTDPATGQPVCRSALAGTDPACVPYNIFQIGGVTQAALDYLQVPAFQTGFTEQSVVGATLAGDLGQYGWRLPWAKDGVGVAFGLERRVEKLEFHPDNEYATGDLTSFAGATLPIDGRYTVKEAYTEVKVPIIQDRPWAQLLSVNGSYRYSDYSTNHTTDTYGIGAEWAPIKELRFRGSYQEATRAANIIELFLGQGLNLFNMAADPCGTSAIGGPPTATLAQCLKTGLPANLYGSVNLTNQAGQYNYLQGGNPNLDPEKSKSYTLGVVWSPTRNLSASLDYWKIKLDNVVSRVPPSLAVTQCINSGQFCDLIHRDPVLGTLWANQGFVTGTNINLSKRKTSGVDVNANYLYSLNTWGSLAFNFVGTWVKEFTTEPIPGLGDYDCAGLYGATCGTPTPKWRHKLRGTWSTPWNVDISATWRYIDSVDVDLSSGNPLLSGDFFPVVKELGARNYIDLAGSWAINKTFTLWGGVNNLFDRDPPITDSSIAGPAAGNGNTYPQVYDALGRRIFISLTAKF